MKKIKLLLLGLVTLSLFLIISYRSLDVLRKSGTSSVRTDSAPSLESSDFNAIPPELRYINVKINFGDGKEIESKVFIDKPTTAYSALIKLANEKKLIIETKKYDFGVFVESIDGYKSSSNKAWIYFVNGNSGTVSADQKEVVGIDTLEWKYIAPSE